MRYIIVIASYAAVFYFGGGCSSGQENLIRKADWLIGTWENKAGNGTVYETWTRVSETELSGKSYALNDQDTIVFESIQLIQENDSLFYIPIIKDHNQDKPIRFTAKNISDTELTFENPAHDFPQRITYSRITSDSLIASISGNAEGQEQRQVFPMRRKQ